MAGTLRPGYLETEDVRQALASQAGDDADLEALAAAFLADAGNVQAIEAANGEVANAELAAYQAANDTLADRVDAFLSDRRA